MSTKEDVIIALLREVMGKVEAIIQQRERIKRKTAAGGRDIWSYRSSRLNERPTAFAALAKALTVTPSLSGSSKRSSCAREVASFFAIATLDMPCFFHVLCKLICNNSLYGAF